MPICLAMMSRDPAEVVARAVESARPFVDQFVLVVAPGDPLMAAEFPIPTRIIEHAWEGYAATRTATLRYAESDLDVDWVLMLDARSTISGRLPPLDDADAYEIAVEDVASRWRWMRGGHLIRARRGFAWSGTGGSDLHETMRVPAGRVAKQWPGLVYRGSPSPKSDGAGRTYLEDARKLAAAFERDPSDTRTAFYLAQSLKDAGLYQSAFEMYLRRADMAVGFSEEVWWAVMWAAKIAPFIGEDPVPLYERAHQLEPNRAEPLAGLGRHFYRAGYFHRAVEMLDRAAACPYPTTARLFVDVNDYSASALADAGIAT